ncbi:putative protein-serine/threonine phosphatase [Helianthus annuus]|nr:putative protein-serine/threonine phosphatase [Helianthus annuus]
MGSLLQRRQGEDYFLIKPDCQRVPGNPSIFFSVFAIFDGHNGISAAIFAKENLLNNILSAIPQGCGREEWLQALPRALVAGFVKTDIEFQQKGEASGTIFTFVVIDGWTISVASNVEERERVTASGSEVGRLHIFRANGDALSFETPAQFCHRFPVELSAKLVVKEALRSRGPKDDTTCVTVDIIPYGYPAIPQTPKKETKSAHFTHSRKEISYVFE